MRIPLVPSPYQAMMSGLTQGTNMAHAEAQNAALAANEAIARQSLAMKKQLLPLTMANINSQMSARNKLTTAQVNELSTKMDILGQTFAWKKDLANQLMGGKSQPSTSTGMPPGAGGNASAPAAPGRISVSPIGQITTPNGTVISPNGSVLSRPTNNRGFSPQYAGFSATANAEKVLGQPPANPTSVMQPSAPLTTTNPSANIVTGPTEGFSPGQIAAGSLAGLKLPGYQASESPVQKANLAVQQSSAVQNKKLRDQYRTQIQALQETMGNLDNLRGIVEGPDGKEWWNGGIFGFGSDEAGKLSNNKNRALFKADTAKIVALLGKQFSARGSNFGTKTAMSFKPHINLPPEQNAGMIEVQGKNEQLETQQLLQNYLRAGGSLTDFPNITSDLDPNRFTNVTPNTNDPVGPVKLVNGTIKYMPYSQYKSLPKGS